MRARVVPTSTEASVGERLAAWPGPSSGGRGQVSAAGTLPGQLGPGLREAPCSSAQKGLRGPSSHAAPPRSHGDGLWVAVRCPRVPPAQSGAV